MALALMGLIVIQVRLVRKSIKSAEEEWDAQIYNLLDEVTDKVEEQEIAFLLSESFGGDSIGLNRDEGGEVGAEFKSGDISVRYDQSEENVKVISLKTPANIRVDSVREKAVLNDPGSAISFSNGKLLMNAAMTRNVINRSRMAYDLEVRANDLGMEGLIEKALLSQQIDLRFDYWVTDKRNDIVLGEKPLSEGADLHIYSDLLFSSGDIKNQNGLLWLSFPGRQRYLYASSAMNFVLSGGFILIIIVLFWLTIRNLLKQKRLSKVKTDFINQMTHEFKTPIATIALAADSLNNSKVNQDPEQIALYSRIIKEESGRMNTQVESILEMAQLNRDEIKLKLEQLNMNTLVECAIETVKLRLSNREGTIRFKPLATSVFVSGDQKYLESVVVNLLDNAIKYCVKRPVIEVGLTTEEGFAELSVSDNGIGIEQEYRQKIFEKFYRIPSENNDYVSGSGLGLSYVRSVLDMHHAQIRVEKGDKSGSVFKVSLPQINE